MSDPPSAWHDVPTGCRVRRTVEVVPTTSGVVHLPVLVIRGEREGPTLLVTGGVHGDEFEGPAALWKVFADLIPERLSGTFVAVPVANPPACEAGLRTNPDDRQDLARVFPGDPGGTVTEQIAHCLTHRFIRHASFYLDLHSAGQYYRMPALVGYQLRPEPLASIQRNAARAFGVPVVWGTPGLPGRSLSAAGECGVPALYAEITGEGRCRTEDVDCYTQGVRRLLGHLGMLEGIPATPEPRWFVEDDSPRAGFLQVQNRAQVGGIFLPTVEAWDRVTEGQEVGGVRGLDGEVLQVVRAPHTGRVVFLRTYPRVHPGEPLCTVLRTED